MFKRHIIMVNDMAFKTSWPSSQSTYLMLLVVVVVAATVFSLTVVRYVGEGCVTDYRRWGPFAGGSPYYISLYVDSLIPYTRSYCVAPAFAPQGELFYNLVRITNAGREIVGDCLAQGEFLGYYPNPYYSGYVYVEAWNICVVTPSYYTRFTLTAYYD